jgi:hypothetical protein
MRGASVENCNTRFGPKSWANRSRGISNTSQTSTKLFNPRFILGMEIESSGGFLRTDGGLIPARNRDTGKSDEMHRAATIMTMGD